MAGADLDRGPARAGRGPRIPSSAPHRRWTGRDRAAVVGAVLLALAAAAATVVSQTVKDPAVNYLDLLVYRDAVSAWQAGQPVYELTFTTSVLPFTYPPFALVALSWLPLLAVRAAGATQLALSLVATLTISAVTIRAALPAARRTLQGWQRAAVGSPAAAPVLALLLFAGALGLEPVTHTLDFGQINLVLCALVLLDQLVVPARARGVLTGLATAVKLTPGIFLLHLLVTGQRRAAARLLLTAVAATLLAALVNPRSSLTYWTSTVFVNRTGPAISASNQNWTGVVDRLLPGHPVAAPLAIVVLDLATVVVAALAVGRLRADRPVTGLAVTGLAGLLVSPVSWSHHWVWVIPLLGALVLERPCRAARPLAGLVVVAFAVAAQWHVPHFFGRELAWTWWQVLLGNSYTGCAVLVLAAVTVLPAAPAACAVTPPREPVDAGSRRADEPLSG